MPSVNQAVSLSISRQWLWGVGALGFTLMERMLIIYVVFYYLPPQEYRVIDLVSDQVFWGIFTVLGIALLLGRVVDGFADPVVATLSDKTNTRIGRRKPFLLASALPMAAAALLMFFPPGPGETSLINGIWVAIMWSLFYVFFTAYITPYFALISELGHSTSLRINLGTIHAFFALLAMIAATIFFPMAASALQGAGIELRSSYQFTAALFALIAMISMFLATLSYNEKKHCIPPKPPTLGMWKSMGSILSFKPFRTFLFGELLLQFAIYILNLGLLYYVVVIFQRDDSFLTLLGGITIGVALLSFPIINKASKKIGKKKLILLGVLIMSAACFVIFALSWDMSGAAFYISLFMFGLGGITLSTCTILTVPTYADLAKEEASRTGVQREAMFYAARNLPLKLTIALAGVTFAYLISAFGRDIANPLGVQLTLLVVAVFSLISYFFFAAYPEAQIQSNLSKHEAE